MTPVAKGRPRFGKGRTYTPDETKAAERTVAFLSSPHAPDEPAQGPVTMSLEFVMPLPPSYSKKLWGQPHTKKPDLDNLSKLVMDALGKTKQWWRDDSQVWDLVPPTRKRYQLENEIPGVWIGYEAA